MSGNGNKKRKRTSITKITTYKTLNDLKYKFSGNSEVPKDIPDFDLDILDINTTSDLLKFIEYIKLHKLYKYNTVYKNILKCENSVKEIDNMVGLNEIKEAIVNQIFFSCKLASKSSFSLSDRISLNAGIYGPPGCGKTTVAKILAKIYYEMGLIEKDSFIVGKRENLIGKYVGHTDKIVKNVLTSAKGGILFLDEVYQFGTGGNSSSADFGKEVANCINQHITECCDPIIFIAGYYNETKDKWFAMNPGLERRFRRNFHIKKYSSQDLYHIFEKQLAQENYKLTTKSSAKLLQMFTNNLDLFPYSGGDTENLLNYVKIIHEKRTLFNNDEMITIKDINLGLENYKKSLTIRPSHNNNDIIMSMYT